MCRCRGCARWPSPVPMLRLPVRCVPRGRGRGPGAVKKSRSSVGRVVRCCASRATPPASRNPLLAGRLKNRRVTLSWKSVRAGMPAHLAGPCPASTPQRLPCSFAHRSGRKSDRRIRRASTALQFARRRAPIVRFCPARLLAALTPTQANLAGDSTFVRVRMGRQGRWPNAWAAGRGTERGRSSLGQWSSRAVLQVPER